MTRAYENALQDLAQIRQERDALAARVSALREGLEKLGAEAFRFISSSDAHEPRQAYNHSLDLLASTADAAASHDAATRAAALLEVLAEIERELPTVIFSEVDVLESQMQQRHRWIRRISALVDRKPAGAK